MSSYSRSYHRWFISPNDCLFPLLHPLCPSESFWSPSSDPVAQAQSQFTSQTGLSLKGRSSHQDENNLNFRIFFLPDWVDASAALPAKALTKPSAWPSKAPHWHSHLHVFLFVHTLQIIQICLKAICFRVFYKPTRSRSKSFSTSWCLDRATLWWWKLYKDKDDVEDDDESALEWVRPKQPRQRRLWHQVLWEQNTLCTRWLSIAASMTWVSNLHTHP